MSSDTYFFLFFLVFKMPTDAQQSVPSRVSRHFKWMERSQYGRIREKSNKRLPVKPSHLFTSIDSGQIGERRKKKKRSFRGLIWAVSCSLACLARLYPTWSSGLDGGSDSRIRYRHNWTAWTTGNARSGSRITMGTVKTWMLPKGHVARLSIYNV